MNDAEFRRRAHAWFVLHKAHAWCDPEGHIPAGEEDALLAAGPHRSSACLRAAIVAELDKDGVSLPYEIAERMDAPATAVPAIIRDLGLVKRGGDGSFMRPPRKEPT